MNKHKSTLLMYLCKSNCWCACAQVALSVYTWDVAEHLMTVEQGCAINSRGSQGCSHTLFFSARISAPLRFLTPPLSLPPSLLHSIPLSLRRALCSAAAFTSDAPYYNVLHKAQQQQQQHYAARLEWRAALRRLAQARLGEGISIQSSLCLHCC